jgi:LuxR family transcriptional regulator, maltose regulon positive regulatory protein
MRFWISYWEFSCFPYNGSMTTPILATKLYIPPTRPNLVSRPYLIGRLNEGLLAGRKLSLISASAGFGKTTLVSEWVANFASLDGSWKDTRVAWLSLDEGDNEPVRFLTYLIAALQTVIKDVGAGILVALQSPQPPAPEVTLTSLLNEITAVPDPFILVLDDYHALDSKAIDQALMFLVEHLPPQMHLAIATREDPQLPLARLRGRGQLTELRAADLRFTPAEAADFLNRLMSLHLSEGDISALDKRTEGWIAGLQLAALTLQGQSDTASFIQSFTGSHHFVLDYLIEEVLQRQPENIQAFLLRTSVLSRLCGPLCDAVLSDSAASGQATIEYLERANLFIVPLDNERCWYRYHHLFGDLLRKRLGQSLTTEETAELHVRASQWYEDNGLPFEAFRHATLANDVERAERLIQSKEMPSYFRGVAMAILDWLLSLPKSVLDSRPVLWVKSGTLSLVAGQTTGVEERLQAAENALQRVELDEKSRDLIGQIACARATLALTRYDPETMLIQAHRAMEYLSPDDLPFRFTASWAMASAYLFQGNRAAAAPACMEGMALSEKSGDTFSIILAASNLGELQELENQLYQASETYKRVLTLFGDHPQPNAAESCLGLARIYYEWNDLETAGQYARQSLVLARQYDRMIDRFVISEALLARLKSACGDADGAMAQLAQTEQSARQQNFLLRLPDIAAAQALVLLQQGQISAADQLVQQYNLPLLRARVLLAQGNPSAALHVLASFRQQMESKGWADERLKAIVLQAVALHRNGEKDKALDALDEALKLAEPGGFIRLFLDEGDQMAELLSYAAKRGAQPDYVARLLAAFPAKTNGKQPAPLIEPLSSRELDVLRLIAQGLSNQEIGERLFLALDTVKGHNRRIFDKLQVERRTEAISRARELGLL